MKPLHKVRINAAQRRVSFKCGHSAYKGPEQLLDWATTQCPTCGEPGIRSEQGPAALEALFRL